jgi:hypothetical protein
VAYTYRSSSSQGNASGSGLTVTKPAGVADGDLLIVAAYLESDTNTWASVGAGFNTSAALTQDNTGAFQLQVWWKIAASEPASWTWTPTTGGNWRTVVCAAYSGGSGSGERVDVAGGAQGDGVLIGSQTAPSVTTTVADDLLAFAYANFSGTDSATTVGAASNLRVSFGGLIIADATIASPGATGTTRPSDGPGTEDYAALHVAFFLSPGGGAAAGGTMSLMRLWGP